MKYNRHRPEALHYSIAELGFILFFLAAAAAVLLYSRAMEEQARAAETAKLNEALNKEVARLSEEVDFLNEILAEKEHGVVPCWRRPDGEIPPLVGVVTIHHRHALTLEHHNAQGTSSTETASATQSRTSSGPCQELQKGGASENSSPLFRLLEVNFTEEAGPLREAVLEMFHQELAYAREKNCYLRIAVINETNSFAFYQSVSTILVSMGIVVVSR